MTTDQLTLAIPGITITETGAGTDLATPQQILAGLKHCRSVGAAWRWIVGDLVLALVDGDPKRLHEAWTQVDSLDIDSRPSLVRSVALAYVIPPEMRRPSLSWGHHEAVACEQLTADDRIRWLDLAEAEGLTVAALSDAIAEEIHGPAPDDDAAPTLLPRVKRTVVAEIEDLWARDPDAAVVLRADGTWRVLTP